ncbi:MAG: hypothetical protein JRG86_08990, partial [Deltaproteobacteria bacterium]|nr:hypothetical protein [Deltaproteobacteria bacterium]
MTELVWRGTPERPALRRAIRQSLLTLNPSLRFLAEDVLAESSAIDLLAIGEEHELVAIRIADAGGDLALLTRGLADRAWLRPRIVDWLKLAPELGLAPDAAIRSLLLCPDFGPETRAATRGLPEGHVELIRYRCLRDRGQLAVLLDPIRVSTTPCASQTHAPRPAPSA